MAFSNRNAQELIVYYSTTAGLPPSSESTTYDATGDRLQTVGLVELGVQQTLLDDERVTARLTDVAGPKVLGLRRGTVSTGVYLTGTGVTTTGAQVSETAQSRLLKCALGGQARSNATTAKVGGPHSTTTVTLTATTNHAIGQIIGIIFASDANSIVHVRRIANLVSDLVTFDQALPSAPSDGDKVVGAITLYPDPAVLGSSEGNSGSTACLFVRQGHAATYGVREYRGCKPTAKLTQTGTEERPLITYEWTAATHRTPADTGSTGVSAISSTPAFSGTLHGLAPLAGARRGKCYFEDYGVTTATSRVVTGVEFDFGVSVVPVDAATNDSNEMQGISGYTCGPIRPTATVTVTPLSDEHLTDLQSGTYKAFRWELQYTEGKTIVVGMPRCSISAAPVVGVNGEVLAHTLTLMAHEDTIASTAVGLAPVYVGIL